MPASSFDFQPTLIGELLQLRPIRPEDFDALFAGASDPLIWEQHPEPDRYKKDIFQTYFDSAINSGGGLIVIDRATGTVIGSSRFYDFRPDKSQISIGYTFLSRRYWGGRYNGEMKSLMLSHAFQFVDKVIFEVGATNLRSRRAIEKVGAKLILETELHGKPYTIYMIQKVNE